MMAQQQIPPFRHHECGGQGPTPIGFGKVDGASDKVLAVSSVAVGSFKVGEGTVTHEPMAIENDPTPAFPASAQPPKSALSQQLDQFIENPVPAQHASCRMDGASARPLPNEKILVRRLYKMITNEEWLEMDEFIRSPEFASYRSGIESSKVHNHQNGSVQRQDDTMVVGSLMRNMTIDKPHVGCDNNDVSPMEIVHFACRFNPPRTIIRHLSSLYPEGVTRPDKTGRLPLHYAVKWGASVRLIYYLLEKDRNAAGVKDSLGKTPLHLLCENYVESYDPRNAAEISAEESLVAAVKILVDAYPDAVNIEDNNDYAPIEYAIEADAPYKAVRFLQKTSERDWKERKKTSMPGENSHVKIEEKFQRDQEKKQLEEGMSREMPRDVSQSKAQYDMARLRCALNQEKPPNRNTSTKPNRLPTPATRQTRSKYAMSA